MQAFYRIQRMLVYPKKGPDNAPGSRGGLLIQLLTGKSPASHGTTNNPCFGLP